MADVQGNCSEAFTGVRDVLAANLDAGLDVGASVAVVLDGEPVVDLWGGDIDDAGTPWDRDTIVNVWSTTKTMTALCALILADRGDLDLHAPVCRYWPEFAAEGKEAVEVRHLLGHTAGLPGWQVPMPEVDLYDWELATSRLAAQAPWWLPGSASGYHAITQGFLIGEVVRRLTGESVGTFFAKEIAEVIDADFHIGTGSEHDARIARVIAPPPMSIEGIDLDGIAFRALSNPPLRAEASWEEAWRRAEIPAANGHGNARSVAKVQAIISGGGQTGGKRFLSEAGCERIFEQQSNGVDLVLGVPLRLGMGYGLNAPETPVSPNPRACYWGGWGGSIVVNDLDARMTVAYMMNRMGEGTVGDERGASIVGAAHAALAAR